MTGLQGKRVLVVEDDYGLATDIVDQLSSAGVSVIGPSATVGNALLLLEGHRIDAAVLDINLGGEMVFPVADTLAERGAAIMFLTGYDAALVPRRFAQYVACEKPLSDREMLREMTKALSPPWMVVVGASGGQGVEDLQALLGRLTTELNAIVMVVLHRPWESRSELAKVLNQESRLPVQVARDGERLQAGRVYIGEPARLLRLGWHQCAELVDDPRRLHSNRTVDLLFDSAAERGAGRTIGIVLSGALDDGARGLARMEAAGGHTMIVPPSDAAARGMARNAAAGLGALNFVGDAPMIAKEIERIVRSTPAATLWSSGNAKMSLFCSSRQGPTSR